jgi:tetratricopeptide (TPR) repeat protein
MERANSFDQTRKQGKLIFKQGNIKESFTFFEEKLINPAREEKNDVNLAIALLQIGRLKQEIGLFVEVEKAIEEVARLLELETVQAQSQYVYLRCKFFHLKAKNLARSLYQQASFETFFEGIAYMESIKGSEEIKNKFLCKLYEGLAHLYCDPLVFEKGEVYINKADAIYSAISTKNSAYAKFLIKKSSFMKKYGFFDVAVGILQDLEKSLPTMIEQEEEREVAKKLLFKVFRD